MTDIEILHKTYDKAVQNGYTDARWGHNSIDYFQNPGRFYGYILSHDFAKALWGEELHYFSDDCDPLPLFKYHLQQMVIADNPIEYLGINI